MKTKLYIPLSSRIGIQNQDVYILEKNSNGSYSFIHETEKTNILEVDGKKEFASEYDARESAVYKGYAISGPSSVKISSR